jgi:hypothetical protein
VSLRRKRTIAIAAVSAVAALGGGAAYAATSANDSQQELLSDAAQRLDVSPDELRAALEGAFGDQLDDAVRAGRLTQAQADRMKQASRDHGLPLGGPGGPGEHGRHVFLAGPIGPGIDAAADYLGLTQAQLRERLENGRTLAQVARAEGKSVAGLEQAIVDAARADLDRAVADGDLTDAERDEMIERLEDHVDDLVAGRHPGGPPHAGFEVHRDHVGPAPFGAEPHRDHVRPAPFGAEPAPSFHHHGD